MLIGQYKILLTTGSTRGHVLGLDTASSIKQTDLCETLFGLLLRFRRCLLLTSMRRTLCYPAWPYQNNPALFSLPSPILWKYNRFDFSDKLQDDPIAIILLADLCDVSGKLPDKM